MAGSKTRFGFAGDGSEPPDSDEARGARTVLGRDIHLQLPPGFAQPSGPVEPEPLPAPQLGPTPTPVWPTPMLREPTAISQTSVQSEVQDEPTDELPSRRSPPAGGSHLARFLGRWTDSGRLVSDSRMPGRRVDVRIPRDPLGRNLLFVLVIAAFAFSVTLVLVKLRQHYVRSREAASAPTQVSAPAAAIPPAAQPVPSLPLPPPASAPPSPAAQSPAVAIPVATGSAKAVPPGNAPPSLLGPRTSAREAGAAVARPSASRRSTHHQADPPSHLKDELLPLQR
jgi:hypothetical protein